MPFLKQTFEGVLIYIDSLWNMCYKINKEHFYYIGASEENRNAMIEALLTNYVPSKYIG